MAFHSVLFETRTDRPQTKLVEPGFFRDLNLDQIVRDITDGYTEYNLTEFFYGELCREEAIVYRHEVMHDLEDVEIANVISSFSLSMRQVREHLSQAEKLHYQKQKQWWFLEATRLYSSSVETLSHRLHEVNPRSRGLQAFVDYVNTYLEGNGFVGLKRDIASVRDALASIRYCVRIRGNTVSVQNFSEESDFSAYVLELFGRFKQGEVKHHLAELRDWPAMDHVEAKVLDFIAQLNPVAFTTLADFNSTYAGFLDPTIAAFDREIQFYLAYRRYTRSCRDAKLAFCYPRVSVSSKAVHASQTFDLALAHGLCAAGKPVVCNDFHLEGGERILVVSGPNNGGKTTFARTFGQLHYLGRLGLPVPGSSAALYLYDALFAHFEREENATDLRGKLQDDLFRMHAILDQATTHSIVLMNEIFSSTTLADALFLCHKIIGVIMTLDALCVCVTFMDELSTLGPQTVSVVSEIDPVDPARRTFRVSRRVADGRAYAMSVAQRYGLTYERLMERLPS